MFKPTSIKIPRYKETQKTANELTVSGFGPWETHYFGWHATGILKRDLIKNNHLLEPWGLVNIYGSGNKSDKPSISFFPKQSQHILYFGYPHESFGKERIKLLKIREKYSISGFVGTAKVYEFLKDSSKNSKYLNKYFENGTSLGFLVIDLKNEDTQFSTVLLFEHDNQVIVIADKMLDELNSNAKIRKIELK